MKKIKVKILNPDVVRDIRDNIIYAARLTQHAHNLKGIDDLCELKNKPYSEQMLKKILTLNHPTLQKLNTINIVVHGCSRRFLSQITRHQNEIKFISSSIQYSDWSEGSFVQIDNEIDYSAYISKYNEIKNLVGKDNAGYVLPQALRGCLLISVSPYEIKHIMRQRLCKRNTDETIHIMKLIFNELNKLDNIVFSYEQCYPQCNNCPEKHLTCGKPYKKEN